MSRSNERKGVQTPFLGPGPWRENPGPQGNMSRSPIMKNDLLAAGMVAESWQLEGEPLAHFVSPYSVQLGSARGSDVSQQHQLGNLKAGCWGEARKHQLGGS